MCCSSLKREKQPTMISGTAATLQLINPIIPHNLWKMLSFILAFVETASQKNSNCHIWIVPVFSNNTTFRRQHALAHTALTEKIFRPQVANTDKYERKGYHYLREASLETLLLWDWLRKEPRLTGKNVAIHVQRGNMAPWKQNKSQETISPTCLLLRAQMMENKTKCYFLKMMIVSLCEIVKFIFN